MLDKPARTEIVAGGLVEARGAPLLEFGAGNDPAPIGIRLGEYGSRFALRLRQRGARSQQRDRKAQERLQMSDLDWGSAALGGIARPAGRGLRVREGAAYGVGRTLRPGERT